VTTSATGWAASSLAAAQLDDISYAKCEDVKSISQARLIARLGTATEPATFDIGRILRYLLDI
jgi:mRNA-degrading endonuclease toxin of MazEF toxin-antitoxin module